MLNAKKLALTAALVVASAGVGLATAATVTSEPVAAHCEFKKCYAPTLCESGLYNCDVSQPGECKLTNCGPD